MSKTPKIVDFRQNHEIRALVAKLGNFVISNEGQEIAGDIIEITMR